MGVYRPPWQEGKSEGNKDIKDKGPKPCPVRTPERKVRISEQAEEKVSGQLS